MKKNPITKDGYEKLKEKLNHLKSIERINIINDIKRAREYGDLKENAEYHAAKEEQFLIEKKIKELENKIANSQIIDIKEQKNTDKVLFGSTINIINLENEKKYTYTIVGEDEADIKINKLSINSPLAKMIIQKSIGEIIKITTPNGIIKYKIIDIKYI